MNLNNNNNNNDIDQIIPIDHSDNENDDNEDDANDTFISIDADFKDFERYLIDNNSIDDDDDNDDDPSMIELPKSLIITNMDSRIFQPASDERNEFENAFLQLDSNIKFLYFKSFRRARLDFSSQKATIKARIVMNQMKFGDEQINCYFAEIPDKSSSMNDKNNHLLKPPALEKQFLISPPASPPEGWEPIEEAQPILNLDLQSALANLLPGQTHELHASTINQPAIVVHVCNDRSTIDSDNNNNNNSNDNNNDSNDDEGFFNDDISASTIIQSKNQIPMGKVKISQTPCPPRRDY